MRLLGIAENYTRDGYLVVKPYVKNPLRLMYLDVLDSAGRIIGRIIDIIGKVEDPRIIVKLVDRDLGEFLTSRRERLYYTVTRRRGRKYSG